jgi:GNAT superfamily N-acetyltransferase
MEAVRKATAYDGPRLAELAREFLDDVASIRGGSLLIEPELDAAGEHGLLARLPELVEDRQRLVVVGSLDEAVVGFALCRYLDLGEHGRRGTLDACYVEPGARELGLGRMLLDASVTWFKESGCRGADGTALPGDRGAKNFFEAAGFKARMLTMYQPFD